jgi:type IV pilus assembly protein PilV
VHTRSGHGFTLIEVLVALLVLAIGIAGAVGVQWSALRTRHATALMSAGVQLGAALAERMRANSSQLRADDSANAYLNLRYDGAHDGAPTPPASPCFGGTLCSSAQMADFDSYEIKYALHSSFPDGRIAVCRDGSVWSAGLRSLVWECAQAANAPIVIKLGWRDRRADPQAPIRPALAMIVAGAFP